ncbi:MAG: putative beta-lysine N-acetyltransferase [Fidelibacterota bacterium]
MQEHHFDIFETLSCGSKIQHGTYNDRIYLMHAEPESLDDLPLRLINMAKEKGYGKIFAKLPESQSDGFIDSGYRIEGEIPGFYRGREKGVFLGYYVDNARKKEADLDIYRRNKQLAMDKKNSEISPLDTSRFHLRPCNENDLEHMAEIYKTVFPSYPFPIHDTGYLRKTMKTYVDYFGIEVRGELIALSSSEKYKSALHAEMTDFATLPDWRGNSLAVHLLLKMEEEMRRQGFVTVFTIARAASPGMNITFAKCGYDYGGRLVNNTNISGNIESMNIWFKALSPQ